MSGCRMSCTLVAGCQRANSGAGYQSPRHCFHVTKLFHQPPSCIPSRAPLPCPAPHRDCAYSQLKCCMAVTHRPLSHLNVSLLLLQLLLLNWARATPDRPFMSSKLQAWSALTCMLTVCPPPPPVHPTGTMMRARASGCGRARHPPARRPQAAVMQSRS